MSAPGIVLPAESQAAAAVESEANAYPLRALPLHCARCNSTIDAAPTHICADCLGPLSPLYDPDRALPSRAEISSRPATLWRYREWLPFHGTTPPALPVSSGWTPLVEAPRLADQIGVARVLVKNDAVCHPTLSFKDRVVTTALNAAASFGLGVVGCASTGNLANAVAAQAARAGLPAWIFIPEDLEPAKVIGTSVYAPTLVRVRGTYDDVNRLCSQVADHFGWGIVNVNLRAYYGEGSKTVAYEIAEQSGWHLPDAVVAPMAGGSLVGKLWRGFHDFIDAGLVGGTPPRLYGAQADGCAPIVRMLERGDRTLVPERPATIARSLAIGAPADGANAERVLRESGGWGARVSDAEIVDGIRLLAETTGIFTETAGGVTVAAARALARSGQLKPEDDVVLSITGNGLKTVDAVAGSIALAPPIAPRLREVIALAEGAG
ncbi:MAG TPA: threonine synthase [Gemmatimonadaceae bacterium]|nr:threonine synthase [Gemmatimonadaceae bacterium]